MTLFATILLVGLGWLSGCGGGRQTDDAAIVEAENRDSAVQPLRGHAIWGHEVRSFTPCASEQDLWVIDRTGGQLRAAHEAWASEPYGRLYVELRGRIGPVPETGFGADYDGQLELVELTLAGPERPDCDGAAGDTGFETVPAEPSPE